MEQVDARGRSHALCVNYTIATERIRALRDQRAADWSAGHSLYDQGAMDAYAIALLALEQLEARIELALLEVSD